MKKFTKILFFLALMTPWGIVSAATTDLAEPTSAATAPTVSAAKVISVFSNAYSSLSGTNFNPGWGQQTQYSAIQVAGNDVIKYANLNYQGTEFTDVNATGMDYVHVDVWTPNETTLDFFLISRTTGEKSFRLEPLPLNQWNGYEIPLTAFTSLGLSVADIFQFKFVGLGGNIVYLDNLYFYNSSSDVDTQVPTAFTATAGTSTSTSISLLLNATDNSNAVTYEISYGTNKVTTIGTSAVQKTYKLTGLTPATEYNFSIVAKDAAGNQATNSPIALTVSTTDSEQVLQLLILRQ